MAYKLQLKRGVLASLPNGSVGEPLFTTDTFDLYVGKGDGTNVKLQKFIASGSSSQFLKGDGSLDSNTYQGVLSGSGIVKSTGGTISYLTDNSANWDSAYNDKINSASVSGTTTKTLTLTQQDGGTITASWSDYDTAPVTSVFGRTGVVVAASGDYTTSLVTEGTNLYFTDARARAAITLTTTGSSGSATYVGGTLNVPTYTLSGLGGVPTSRSLTINGTSYDLSADRSWSVGTVTSVDLSVPTGFAISGNPITSSGTLALAFATGYSLPTTASQTNWDAAYNDKINSASVTGTTTKTLTLTQQDGGTITASWTDDNTDAVTSVFGRTGAVVAQSGDYTTTQVTEGTNLYYTEARVSANTDVAANTAARHNAVTLGTANGLSLSTQQLSLALASSSTTGALSSTDWTTFNNKENAITAGTTLQYYRGDKTFQTLNTSVVPESGNLYYTDARSRAALSFVAGSGAYNSTTGVITIPTNTNQLTNGASFITLASLSGGAGISYNNTTGVIASTITQYTDAMARASLSFAAGSGAYNSTTGVITIPTNTNQLTNGAAFITLGSLSASAPLSYNNGTGDFTISQASSTTNGFLSSTDWNTFNNKQNALTNPVTGTGSTNYLPKWTSSSALVNSLVYDNGTTIALGNTANGTGYALEFNNNASTPRIDLVDNGTYTGFLKTNGLLVSVGNNSANAFTINTAGIEKMRITSSGSVGIGTTSPGALLDVNGNLNVSASGNIFTASTSGIFFNGNGSFAVGIYNDNSGVLRFATGSSVRMRLDASGNLGLGVTPSAWGITPALQVVNASLYNQGDDGTYITSNGYYNAGWKYIGTSTATQYQMLSGQHRWYNAPSGTAGNAITFTQAMTLDASGRLGIGTTSASSYDFNDPAKLVVANTSGNSTISIVSGTSSLGYLAFADGTTGADKYRGMLEYNHSDNSLAIRTNGAEAMRITSGGNVGIGTTSPGSRLTVSNSTAGNLTSYIINGVTAASGTTGYGLAIESEASAATSYALTVRNLAGSNTYFHVSTATGMVGNVGIGTTSPNDLLHINGSGIVKMQIQGSTESQLRLNSGYGQISNVSGDLYFTIESATGSQIFRTGSSTERMRITSGGNVGIGTSNPTYILDTYGGEVRFKGSSTYMTVNIDNNSTSGGGGIYFRQNGTVGAGIGLSGWYLGGTSSDLFLNSETGRNIRFAVNAGTEAMIITSGGNVGIGTTNPTERLHVNGNIRTAAPTGYTAGSWKLGTANTGTVTANRYITIEIDGQIYTINALLGTP